MDLGAMTMIILTCPKCRSKVEISDKKFEDSYVTAVFCSDEECFFHSNPLIGLDRDGRDGGDPGVYISETLI